MRNPGFDNLNVELGDAAETPQIPLVSVVMLAYNHGDYIAQAIASVLAQEGPFSMELLIGEDCSSDRTREVALDFQRLYPGIVRLITDSVNVGMHANHVRLLNACHGEYIAYCEGDDYWTDVHKLAKQVRYLQLHPDAGAMHSNYFRLIHIGGAWRARIAFRSSVLLRHRAGQIYEAMLQANRMQTCTVICRRHLVEEFLRSGLADRGYLVEDWPLCLYLARASNIGFIDEPLAAYRRTPGSMMNVGDSAHVRYCLDAIRMVEEFCDFFQEDPRIREESLAAQYRVLLWLALRADDRHSFDRAWSWLEQNAPGRLQSPRVRLMRVLLSRPSLRRWTLRLLAAIEHVKHRCEFREFGARPAA